MVVRARRAQQGRLRQALGLLHANPVLRTQIQRLGATLSPDAHAMLGIQEQMTDPAQSRRLWRVLRALML